MTCSIFVLIAALSIAGVIALRWLVLGIYEIVRGVNAVQEVRRESEVGRHE